MKSKIIAIILMSILLFFVSATGYNGIQSSASTSEGKNQVLTHPQSSKSEMNKEIHIKEVKTEERENTLNSEVPSSKSETSFSPEQLPQEVIIDDTIFENIMDESKFKDLSELALTYEAGLYAIPYSDVFAIVKNDEPILFMSTGVKATSVEYTDLLLKALALNQLDSADHIQENLNIVLETGKEVHNGEIGFGGYTIYKEDGWVYVSW